MHMKKMDAMKLRKDSGQRVRWYVPGEGQDEEKGVADYHTNI